MAEDKRYVPTALDIVSGMDPEMVEMMAALTPQQVALWRRILCEYGQRALIDVFDLLHPATTA